MPHDRFYGIAADEVSRQAVDKDLFARAYALALGDPEKTKAIYIGIRAERLEELAQQLAAAQAREEKERAQAAKEATKAHRSTVSRSKESPPPLSKTPDSKGVPPSLPRSPNQHLPKPEDFTDPKLAEAVRAMLAALEASGGRK